MTLTIRYDAAGKVLRSTDEPPGILVAVYPGDTPATFAVDPNFEPESVPRPDGGTSVILGIGADKRFDEMIEHLAMVDVVDVLDGCAGKRELQSCWTLAAGTWLGLAQTGIQSGELEAIEDGLRFLIEVRDGVIRRLA